MENGWIEEISKLRKAHIEDKYLLIQALQRIEGLTRENQALENQLRFWQSVADGSAKNG